jgi:hypothetical protein
MFIYLIETEHFSIYHVVVLINNSERYIWDLNSDSILFPLLLRFAIDQAHLNYLLCLEVLIGGIASRSSGVPKTVSVRFLYLVCLNCGNLREQGMHMDIELIDGFNESLNVVVIDMLLFSTGYGIMVLQNGHRFINFNQILEDLLFILADVGTATTY